MILKNTISLVAFDLDGTIYNGNQIISGAMETIAFFKKLGKDVCFFTNNSNYTRTQIHTKLRNFSIELSNQDVYCCSYAIQIFLKEKGIKNIHIIGSKTLIEEISHSNVNIKNDVDIEDIDVLLIGMDLEFNYSKLAKAYEVLQKNKNCKIVVCNMDYSFPVENGLRKPGCGAIVSSILSVSEREIYFMIGKPNTYILDIIGKEKNTSLDNILVIGDSLESDIQMAQNANAQSILIDNSENNYLNNIITVDSINQIPKIFNKYFN